MILGFSFLRFNSKPNLHTYGIAVACMGKTTVDDWEDSWNQVVGVGKCNSKQQSCFVQTRGTRLASTLLAAASVTGLHLLLHVMGFHFCALFQTLGKSLELLLTLLCSYNVSFISLNLG
jgi:hypothetical protein